jgi:hypothetical protein
MSENQILPEEKKRKVFSEYFEEYIRQYQMDWDYRHQPVISPLEVDSLASSIAKAYEKVRKVVDWKEENLLRRNAIERILKRKLMSELYGINILPVTAAEVAEPIVLELMRSGYFDNGHIAKQQVKEVERIINKYINIMSRSRLASQKSDKHIKGKMSFYTWLIEIAACEIEEILAPAFKENALLNLMTNLLYQRTRIVPTDRIDNLEKLIQIYISSQRTLYNFDEPIIAYNVIKIRYPYWLKEDKETVDQIVENAEGIYQQIENDLESKDGKKFFKLASKYDAAYRIIGDLLEDINDKPAVVLETLANEDKLDALIEKIYAARKKSLKGRLFRSAIYSTLSLFIAGGFSYFVFEGPVARLAGKEFSLLALFIDLLIPSLVMFVLVIIIRPPPDKNLIAVKKEIKKVIYNSDDDVYEINYIKKKNKVLQAIFLLLSGLAGASSLWFVFWIFKVANVPWTSMYIDTVNVAMVVFAAMAVREKSKEITIEDGGNFAEFLVDLFSIPMAKLGQWFSNKWKEYNLVAALFTALVDTPFSALISLIEDWRNFLKEKSSEIH